MSLRACAPERREMARGRYSALNSLGCDRAPPTAVDRVPALDSTVSPICLAELCIDETKHVHSLDRAVPPAIVRSDDNGA